MSAQGPPKQQQSRGIRLLLLALCAAVTVLIAGEGGLQASVHQGWPPRLADPEGYAHPLCDPWHWRTLARQRGTDSDRMAHPILGWVSPNEVRATTSVPRVDQDVPIAPVVMIGDSFLAGTTAESDTIPSIVDSTLRAAGVMASVEDLAVGGYGLDQILLRLRARASSLESGTPVVIGVLTTDIDRAVLWEREAPKPRFSLGERGRLVLSTDHVSEPMPAPEARLLMWARWRRYWDGRAARDAGLPHSECRVDEKRALGRALLLAVVETCEDAGLRCLVVPFLRAEDHNRPPAWREHLIESSTSSLAQLSVRSILETTDGELYQADRHPSRTQNRAVGVAIAEWVGTALSDSTTP